MRSEQTENQNDTETRAIIWAIIYIKKISSISSSLRVVSSLLIQNYLTTKMVHQEAELDWKDNINVTQESNSS